MHHVKYLLIPVFFVLINASTYAVDRRGRLGVGFTNQLKSDIPAISFKLQRSSAFALGGQIAYNNDEDDGGHGAALKLYRNIFQEPQLVFYGSVLGGIIAKKTSGVEESGFQFDFAMGSEFSFTGLNSIGFSFEFGVSMNKLDEFVIETIGDSFIVSAVHFYL